MFFSISFSANVFFIVFWTNFISFLSYKALHKVIKFAFFERFFLA